MQARYDSTGDGQIWPTSGLHLRKEYVCRLPRGICSHPHLRSRSLDIARSSEHPEGGGVELGGRRVRRVVGREDGSAQGFDDRGEEGHVIVAGLVLGAEEQGLAEGWWWEVLDGAEPGEAPLPVVCGGTVMRVVRCKEKITS